RDERRRRRGRERRRRTRTWNASLARELVEQFVDRKRQEIARHRRADYLSVGLKPCAQLVEHAARRLDALAGELRLEIGDERPAELRVPLCAFDEVMERRLQRRELHGSLNPPLRRRLQKAQELGQALFVPGA